MWVGARRGTPPLESAAIGSQCVQLPRHGDPIITHRLSLGPCLRSLLLGDLAGLLSGVEPRLLGGRRRLRLALGGLPSRVLLPRRFRP
jgi:hypothetical protein